MEHGTLTQKLWMMNNGTNNIKRRIVSISSCVKNDDGTYIFIGRSRLHRSMQHTPSKTKRVRRHPKPTHHE